MDQPLTVERAREVLSYDPETGKLTWLITLSPRAVKGKEAGHRMKRGSAVQLRIDKRLYSAHRVIWLMVYGVWPTEVDHIDNDPLNNRLSNLRAATHAQNLKNMSMHRDNAQGVKGVYRNKHASGYFSQIMVDGKQHYLGRFKTKEQASAAYNAAAKRLHGEFAHMSEVK